MIIKSLPPFPKPNPKAVIELKDACRSGLPATENRCAALYEWIGKVLVLQEQLALYKAYINEK